MYPCDNALHAHLTEVLPALWLPQAGQPGLPRAGGAAEDHEGVFARADIVAGTFVLDFGELRETTRPERSGGRKGWSVRLQVETSKSSAAKTYVVKDAHGRHRRGEVPRGGKVNSTRMLSWCQTTKWVWADSKILVSFDETWRLNVLARVE